MPAKKYFTKKELKEFHGMLEEKREELLAQIRKFEETQKNADEFKTHGDMGDMAVQEVDNALQFRMLDKQRKLLDEVNHAMTKFETGTYGICEGNDDYISKQRLKLRPWTRYSIEHKEHVEEMKKRQQL